MALIVETGSVVAGAESYASVADATAYHAKRGNTAWADLDTDVQEASLRKATDFMVQEYRLAWKGTRRSDLQTLDWPRFDVITDNFGYGANGIASRFLVPSDVVPVEVKNACAELALKAATADLNPDLTQQVISQTVGPISTTYDNHSPQKKRYEAIHAMLRPFLANAGGLNAGVSRT